jgi:hypothetical protein
MTNHTKRATQEERCELKKKIKDNQTKIRLDALETGNLSSPRTQEANTTFPAKTVEEEKQFRADVLSSQIKSWSKLLPLIFTRFSKVPDPRNPRKIKHKIAVLLMHGLMLFLFRFSSRKAINKELSKPQFHENMKALFPNFDSTPHGDTVARLLEKIDFSDIENIHISMVKKLISQKKFRNMLILGHIPISIDGVHKLVRNGESQSVEWLERKIQSPDGKITQQYVAVLEANITLYNGLTIPLVSEFLHYDGNVDNITKQDCELTGFKRICAKLKSNFKRQKIILFLDKLYATENVLKEVSKKCWSHVIVFPSDKLTIIGKQINGNTVGRLFIPNQFKYNGREQSWCWDNNLKWRELSDLHVVSCLEKWSVVNPKTGNPEIKYSEHKWMTNISLNINNLHELCNLGARKRWGIEDSNNTEKNRGYSYKHAFSYQWNAMICFHLLMRLAHAINALSEFTTLLKKYIKRFGCSYILSIIKETLWNPWFSKSWFKSQIVKPFIFSIE